MARLGVAWLGRVCLVGHGAVRRGMVRRGMARCGTAVSLTSLGRANSGRHFGVARFVKEKQCQT
jgi:hypothetical protein